MLGLSSKVVITLDFLGEIYSSAAKNLDFMRVCESVVMNIGTIAFYPGKYDIYWGFAILKSL
jgi:hypothetical protein